MQVNADRRYFSSTSTGRQIVDIAHCGQPAGMGIGHLSVFKLSFIGPA
jgi:hypothetical protein